MARKVFWLVTTERGDRAEAFTTKSYHSAMDDVGKMRGCSDAEGVTFRVFRLTLTNGKIYANRIQEKEKGNEDNCIATQLRAITREQSPGDGTGAFGEDSNGESGPRSVQVADTEGVKSTPSGDRERVSGQG